MFSVRVSDGGARYLAPHSGRDGQRSLLRSKPDSDQMSSQFGLRVILEGGSAVEDPVVVHPEDFAWLQREFDSKLRAAQRSIQSIQRPTLF